jgi:hypothetical protein
LDNQAKENIKIKKKYNKTLFTITKYVLLNQKPPKKLIEKAKELGLQLNIPEEELRNIEFSCF